MKHTLLIIILVTLSFAACSQPNAEQEVDKGYWKDVYVDVASLQMMGEDEKAVAACTAAMKKDPKKIPYYYNLRGVVYESMGKQKEALADYKRAAKLGDENAQSYLKEKGIAW